MTAAGFLQFSSLNSQEQYLNSSGLSHNLSYFVSKNILQSHVDMSSIKINRIAKDNDKNSYIVL